MAAPTFPLSPAWALLLRDLGLPAADVLRRAGVADDLLVREQAAVTADELCRMFRAVDEEANDPVLAIRIGEALSFEMFDPPVFAAMCSHDLDTALDRLAHYKRLCAPIALRVQSTDEATRVLVEWTEPPLEPPPLLFAIELAYCVRLARLGTRLHVQPLSITSPYPLAPAPAYAAFFGRAVDHAPETSITFAAADAKAPFLTANARMWEVFEPELRRRLAELDATASTTERVRAALLELLPSGAASVQAVATRLGASARTLQRRLQDEDTTFQRVLDGLREDLARHYLGTTSMVGAEISFLLGFEDPNSFVRAFHEWTGVTPEQHRARVRRAVRGALG